MTKWSVRWAVLSLVMMSCAACSSEENLSKEEAAAVAAQVWQETEARMMDELRPMWEARVIKAGEFSMPIDVKVYGEKPADGRSLYISMHGGGNTPQEVNDQQWENQKHLYKPAEGVYIAPRAAVNDWNMWFRPHVDTLFARIIRCAVSEMEVNPNKVYLLGYSAGGDGAYRMAPRMADSWAAASMMAGHPGEASPLNLRNIGFMVWMGENDAAYNRNRLAVEYGARMDSLQKADPQGYPHETHIIQGAGHWMNRVDTAAIEWMNDFVRNPYPKRVVWRQEETCLRDHFYYLSVLREEMAAAKELRVEYEGNVVNVLKTDYRTFRIHLNDAMMDLSKEVEVLFQGKTLFKGKVPRRISHITESATKWMDESYIFPAVIEITLGDKRQ